MGGVCRFGAVKCRPSSKLLSMTLILIVGVLVLGIVAAGVLAVSLSSRKGGPEE